MKDTIKKGILAGKILDSMSEEDKDIILEQAAETKPSRINQTKNFRKRENKRKHKFDDDNDS
jgi:tRNA(Ser,Leu) C12 N-acetylase TAN1